ncbi:hypothetical protein HMPREF1870_01130 [Bacteroidales bacterium KA00344]|nr:hypothetical protein HMPREF1870_01130 [Bacteroidales bacterium KA00344]
MIEFLLCRTLSSSLLCPLPGVYLLHYCKDTEFLHNMPADDTNKC